MSISATLYIAGTLFVVGFLAGWEAHGFWTDSGQLAAVEKAAEERAETASAVTDTAIETQREEGEIQIVYRNIEREVIKYVERPIANTVCLDDSALSLLNASGRGESVPVNPVKPDAALP